MFWMLIYDKTFYLAVLIICLENMILHINFSVETLFYVYQHKQTKLMHSFLFLLLLILNLKLQCIFLLMFFIYICR